MHACIKSIEKINNNHGRDKTIPLPDKLVGILTRKRTQSDKCDGPERNIDHIKENATRFIRAYIHTYHMINKHTST